MYVVISTSLNPRSCSRSLATLAYHQLARLSPRVGVVDLAQYSLPFCDGSAELNHHEHVRELTETIGRAIGIMVATPIYNYDVGPATRNLVQLTGPAWVRKVVGFVCVAGGPVSYTSVLSLANSLMLDYRTFVLPDFVFASDRAFNPHGQLVDQEVEQRLEGMAQTLVRVTEALRTA